jgi:hypothetical protein
MRFRNSFGYPDRKTHWPNDNANYTSGASMVGGYWQQHLDRHDARRRQKKMKTLVAVISIVFTVATASACRAESLEAGAGTTTCGQFASNYARDPELMESIYFAWAQGFMT